MGASFAAVDLSQLPFPNAIEALDFETIFSELLADFQSRMAAIGVSFTALVESDPAYKILEAAAYRELLLRQRVNEEVQAVTLAYATSSDLDQIAARYNVQRLVITPADNTTIPPTVAVMESDTALRRRVQLSFDGFSTAGPTGAYVFFSLGADSRVLDASANSPTPGQVVVSVLSNQGDGTAPADLVSAVNAALSSDDVRPLTDQVIVQSATVVDYAVNAVLTLYVGPDSAVVLAAAQAAVAAYTEKVHRLGLSVTRAALIAALMQEGVENVVLSSPAADIAGAWNQASYCTATNITVGGTGE